MAEFEDRYWTSSDGLKLHYREYAGPGEAARPVVICLPGLTRNARDFDVLAPHIAQRFRVLCPDLRGRGDSDYAKDSSTYQPLQYVEDITGLIEAAGVSSFVAIGTSLGGLITMLLAMTMPGKIAGAALNDIGPEVDPAGLERIGGYVGQGRSFPTWMHAARALQESQGHAFPGFELSDWLAMAKRVMTLGSNERIVFDYDMKIAEPFGAGAATPAVDLWPAIGALAGKPVLLLRGETSDILAAETLERMVAMLPGADVALIPKVGHAPTLDEPAAVAGIDRLLARVA